MKVSISNYPKKGKRKVAIKVSDHDTYSLYHTLSLVIVESLKKYREDMAGYPPCLSEKQWQDVIDVMIIGFDLVANDDGWDNNRKKITQVKCSLRLFAKWYNHLWY